MEAIKAKFENGEADRTVKAITLSRYGPSSLLRLEEVPKPIPGDDEILIRVRAASVNDWDWGLMRGKPFYIRLLCGLRKPKIRIPGVDVAGEVETVGRNVTKFRPGDEVYGDISESGFGGFATYVCAHESALAPKPRTMPFIEAAAIPHAATLALQGFQKMEDLGARHKLLINGAGGGVGTLGIQIARSLGIEDVDGVDSESKLEMLRSLGFNNVIDYTKTDFTRAGKQYDLILDTRTNRSVFDYLRALTPNGIYVTVGGSTARLLQAFLLGPLIHRLSKKRIQIVALKPNQGLDYINELFEAEKLKAVIDGPYKLSEAPQAIDHFGNGGHKGKVIISMDQEN